MLCFTLIILSGQNGYAQERDDLLDMALTHFDAVKNENVWWLKDMKGFLDHTHEVRMVLATDNETFRGAYEILSSKQRFYLDGNHDGEQIVLTETDSSGITTGIIRGDMNDDKFYCEWSDLKNIEQLNLFLYTNSPSQNPCGNIGWIKNYTINKDSIKNIVLYKKEEVVKLKIQYLHSRQEFVLDCEDDACNKMANYGTSYDTEKEIFIDQSKKEIKIKTLSGENKYSMNESNGMYFNCKSFMDFERRFSFIYTLTSNTKFNEYINYNFIDKYMSPDTRKKEGEDVSRHDRFAHCEYGDIIIDLFNDTLISGMYILQSSKHNEVTELPFTYFFKKKKEFDFYDFYVDTFDFKESIKAKIDEFKKTKTKQGGPFAGAEYPYVTLSDNGYLCRTKFNTIYGRDEIVIPYKEFSSFYKKKAMYKF